MNLKTGSNRSSRGAALAFAGAFILAGFVGCTTDKSTEMNPSSTRSDEGSSQQASAASPTAASSSTAAAPASAAPAQPAATSEWEAQAPLTIDDEASRRALAEDMIYATIRIKMEDMIERRAALLKAGTNSSDAELRDLERSILRARGLLIEAGEIVEDLEPPILQVRTPENAPNPGGQNP